VVECFGERSSPSLDRAGGIIHLSSQLPWADFVPDADHILRQSMLAEAEKALGLKINLETIGLK
jgi:hypothetical protein